MIWSCPGPILDPYGSLLHPLTRKIVDLFWGAGGELEELPSCARHDCRCSLQQQPRFSQSSLVTSVYVSPVQDDHDASGSASH